jgi:hypothetical protein
MLLLLSSVLISSVALSYASAFQNQENVHLLQERAPSYGGIALVASPCPQGSASCGSSKCCPSQFPFCKVVGSNKGYACCPDGKYTSTYLNPNRFSDKTDEANNCVASVTFGPACADDTWILYQGRNQGYFCCLSNQIGVLGTGGEVGNCVASNVPVSATQSATRVSSGLSS